MAPIWKDSGFHIEWPPRRSNTEWHGDGFPRSSIGSPRLLATSIRAAGLTAICRWPVKRCRTWSSPHATRLRTTTTLVAASGERARFAFAGTALRRRAVPMRASDDAGACKDAANAFPIPLVDLTAYAGGPRSGPGRVTRRAGGATRSATPTRIRAGASARRRSIPHPTAATRSASGATHGHVPAVRLGCFQVHSAWRLGLSPASRDRLRAGVFTMAFPRWSLPSCTASAGAMCAGGSPDCRSTSGSTT